MATQVDEEHSGASAGQARSQAPQCAPSASRLTQPVLHAVSVP